LADEESFPVRNVPRFGTVALTMVASLANTVLAGDTTRPILHVTSNFDWAAQCKALEGSDFSGIADAPTQVVGAKLVEAKEGLPAYCEVSGYVTPAIGVKLGLPVSWTGKFIEAGCGGHCGRLDEKSFATWGCDIALRKGDVCIVSDMGHTGTGSDGLWGYHNLQAKLDWGYRAAHVAALAGKAITERFYAHAPKRSYFMGCSTGGREALQEAQHFPWDFDGIIAGAPPIDLSVIYMTLAWGIRATHDSIGEPLLGENELKLLTAAAVAKCKAGDKVQDGVIGDPLQCHFDPSELACKAGQARECLTSEQIAAAKKVYSGPMTSRDIKLSPGGPLPGSEGNWGTTYVGTNDKPVGSLATEGLRYLFFFPELGPAWRLNDFDFDRDYKRLGTMEFLYDSSNPDLHKFKAAGGKLIAYQGTNDPAVVPQSMIDYYETVERTMGGRKTTQEFFRLFVLPGVNHCSGGVGADAADFLGTLEAWVEQGQAPDRVLSGHLKEKSPPFAYPYREFPADASKLSFTRPVYPYPLRAKYSGKGDPNDAVNFGPVGP
jgi:hypothetical protein